MAGPVISLTSSAQGGDSFRRRIEEVDKFCRWIECAEVVKGWKPWFLGAFDHDLVTFAESREKAFAKFVLGNGRCYQSATMWSDLLGREIVPSDVVEIPNAWPGLAKDWLMNDEKDLTGKPVKLAEASESWPAETLKPVVMSWACRGWYFWLIDGAVLHGWQMAFFPVETAKMLVDEGILYREGPDADTIEPDLVLVETFEDLPSVKTVEGLELFFAMISLEGGDVRYLNPDDDPEGGE